MPIPVNEFKEKSRKLEAKNQIKSVLMQGPARVSEITEKVDRSQSTVSKYLQEFREIEVVSRDENNRYHLNSDLQDDERRILEEIIEGDLQGKQEITENLESITGLETKLEKLIELGYLRGSHDSVSITHKALSRLNRTLSGEKLKDQMVYHTVKSDGFSSYQSSMDPVEDSPKKLLSYLGSAAGIEICDHCGFPLDPDYIRKIVLTDPENPEQDPEEAERERCEELIRELYGPVGSLLQMFNTYQEGTESNITGKHYNTYRKNGKTYHPYCRKNIEEV